MNKNQMFVLGGVICFMLFASLIGLWDLTRHQLELQTGFYDLPFKITVPWYIAGDLFVSLGVASLVLVWYVMFKRRRER